MWHLELKNFSVFCPTNKNISKQKFKTLRKIFDLHRSTVLQLNVGYYNQAAKELKTVSFS
jgi:hypothetical protein